MKIKLLITSVGSFVGQNLLDVLESQIFRRRDYVEIVGTNSIASSPNNFRCDKCYLISNTNSQMFLEEITEIIKNEKPDLVLSGRDEDTVKLAHLMEKNRHLPGKLPYGKSISLIYAFNKWESMIFCERHNLPFASTFVYGKSGSFRELESFIDNHGFPLIAKPIQGFASKGVFFIRDWKDAELASEFEEYMFQEYLGNPELLNEYFKQMDGLTPLFAQAPSTFHHSCYTVIAPNGSFAPVFISRNDHDLGATVRFNKVENSLLEEIANKFIAAMSAEGGYGPFNIQFREDRNGNWKVQEMNMRTTGNTYPKFIMGQDDIGLIINGNLPEFEFPLYEAEQDANTIVISKKLTSYVMHTNELSDLQNNNHWILQNPDKN